MSWPFLASFARFRGLIRILLKSETALFVSERPQLGVLQLVVHVFMFFSSGIPACACGVGGHGSTAPWVGGRGATPHEDAPDDLKADDRPSIPPRATWSLDLSSD